mgnify:CR=1 FL=1
MIRACSVTKPPSAHRALATSSAASRAKSVWHPSRSASAIRATPGLATGTIFTIPALFLWGLAPPYWQVVVLALLGAAVVGMLPVGSASASPPDDDTIAVVAVGGRNDGLPACDPARSVSSWNGAMSWSATATAFVPAGQPCLGGGELYDVARSGNVLLAVGTKQLATGTQGVVFRSTDDGLTWTAVGSIPPTPPGTVALEAIATDGAGRWVAGGASNGAISPVGLYYSDDVGATWTPVSSSASPLVARQIHDIAERPGPISGWAAVGEVDNPGPTDAIVLGSPNGASWSPPATWGSMRDLALRGVAIDAAGTTTAVGTSRDVSASPNLNAPFILRKPVYAIGYTLWQAQHVQDVTMGGLNGVAVDPQGAVIMVGARAAGASTAAVAYRLPAMSTDPLIDLSATLSPSIETLEDLATDGQGTWVAVGGDQGATTRTTNLGASWSAPIEAVPSAKGRGLLRGVTFRS